MAFVWPPQRLSLSSSKISQPGSVWLGGRYGIRQWKNIFRINKTSKSSSTLVNSCQWKKSSVLPWDLLCDTDDWKLAHVFLLFENTNTGVRNFQPTNPPPPLFCCCIRENACNYSVAPIFGAARLIGLLPERGYKNLILLALLPVAKPIGHRTVRVFVVVVVGGLLFLEKAELNLYLISSPPTVPL